MAEIIAENGRLDIVVQNAGIVLGPAEVFTPEQ
jgi:NAD(P)-dependent dehydrogenase (short-subunit alcohol dehydrogenase family)